MVLNGIPPLFRLISTQFVSELIHRDEAKFSSRRRLGCSTVILLRCCLSRHASDASVPSVNRARSVGPEILSEVPDAERFSDLRTRSTSQWICTFPLSATIPPGLILPVYVIHSII